jgi:integration host factor subunit beta
MTKSDLIEMIASKQTHLSTQDVEMSVSAIIRKISEALSEGQRVEIRGFGSFSIHHHDVKKGRNPKTGESVEIGERYSPHFKPGLLLKEKVNDSFKCDNE